MGFLDRVASVQITKSTKYPSARGFGIPLFVCMHSFWLDRVRRFETLTELSEAGVPVTHALYVAVQIGFSQEVSPEAIVIGRRALNATQIVKLTPKIATEGHVYNFKIKNELQAITEIEYTVPAAATLTSVGTALAALIDPVTNVVSVSVAGEITNTSTAGTIATYYDLPPISELEVEETTADPGLATDLAAIELATEKTKGAISWYGFSVDLLGQASALAAMAFAEARQIVYSGRSSDSEIANPAVTDDTFSQAKGLSYGRTHLLFAQSSTQDYRDLSFLCNQLPQEPGSTHGAYKELPGISPDTLSSGEINAILAKNGNIYITTNSVNHTYQGITPEGDYLDNTVFLDWIYARIQETVFGGQVSSKRIYYTQQGLDILGGFVQQVLDAGTKPPNQGFSPDNPPVVIVPKIGTVSPALKATRTSPPLNFTGTLSGALINADIRGTVVL